MSGCDHWPDDGRGYAVPAGTRSRCYHCHRPIVFIAGYDFRRDYWRATGPLSAGSPLPKSSRCTSRCPAVGYLTCELRRNHAGSCRAGGYSWYRGHGYSKPHLIGRPAWDRP